MFVLKSICKERVSTPLRLFDQGPCKNGIIRKWEKQNIQGTDLAIEITSRNKLGQLYKLIRVECENIYFNKII